MRLLAAAGFAAALLAGCGSGTSTTVVSNSTVTHTVTTGGTGSTTTAPTTSTTSAARTVHLATFTSPSGNIGCVLTKQSARCDIKERSWKPPPRPSSCPLDYGQGLIVAGPKKATLVCAGDTALVGTKPLPYGDSSQVGAFLCTSETTSMKCGNTDTGHGFELSREGYKLF